MKEVELRSLNYIGEHGMAGLPFFTRMACEVDPG